MTRTAYEILSIPQTASEAAVERAYQMRLIEAQTSRKLSETEKLVEIAAIEDANRILSRSTSRVLYDKKLAAADRVEYAQEDGGIKRKVIAFIVILAVAAGGYFWFEQRETERIRANQERIVAEQKAAVAAAEAAKARIKFEELQQRDAAERKLSEEARLQEAREQREREMQAEKFVPLQQAAPPKSAAEIGRENIQREINRQVQQNESERLFRQAQQEAERQRRFLLQLQEEEKAAREARAKSANPSNNNPR
jgi:hypothetical protein